MVGREYSTFKCM